MFCFLLYLRHFHRVSIVNSVLELQTQCSKKKIVLPQYSATKGSDKLLTVHRLQRLCC